MKFKAPPPAPEPEEREDVRVAANRCPYCRDDVTPTESVVCQDCLTRHHGACWSEAGACSSCGGARRMERRPEADGLTEAAHRRVIAAEAPALRVGFGVLFASICALAIAGFLVSLWFLAPQIPERGSDAVGALVAAFMIASLLVFAAYPSAKLRLWGFEPEPEPDGEEG